MSDELTRTPMIIVAAPSGAGKSSLCSKALSEIPQLLDTITYTTRKMREHESEGNPYHFVSEEKFKKLITEGFFVEWATVHGKLYGTPKHQIEDGFKNGKWIIMDVDVQGAATFKRLYPGATSIFILPPSIDELRKRIVIRDKGQTTDLEVRLKNAEREIQESTKFDHRIINEVFEEAYLQFKSIILDSISKSP